MCGYEWLLRMIKSKKKLACITAVVNEVLDYSKISKGHMFNFYWFILVFVPKEIFSLTPAIPNCDFFFSFMKFRRNVIKTSWIFFRNDFLWVCSVCLHKFIISAKFIWFGNFKEKVSQCTSVGAVSQKVFLFLKD